MKGLNKERFFQGLKIAFFGIAFLVFLSGTSHLLPGYTPLPSWADPKSEKFDPERLNVRFYNDWFELGEAIKIAFPPGTDKAKIDAIMKKNGIMGYSADSSQRRNHFRYGYTNNLTIWIVPKVVHWTTPYIGFTTGNIGFTFDLNMRTTEAWVYGSRLYSLEKGVNDVNIQ